MKKIFLLDKTGKNIVHEVEMSIAPATILVIGGVYYRMVRGLMYYVIANIPWHRDTILYRESDVQDLGEVI